MAGNLTLKYGSPTTGTVTLNSLAASAGGVTGRASTAIDNSTNQYVDYLVQVTIKNGSGTIAGNKGWWIYAYGVGGSSYDDSITGTDAGFTRTDPPNLPLLMFINAPTSAGGEVSRTASIASVFGGTCPYKWGIFVANDTNITADSTGANFSFSIIPVEAQYS
jgi:hypothetical protein